MVPAGIVRLAVAANEYAERRGWGYKGDVPGHWPGEHMKSGESPANSNAEGA